MGVLKQKIVDGLKENYLPLYAEEYQIAIENNRFIAAEIKNGNMKKEIIEKLTEKNKNTFGPKDFETMLPVGGRTRRAAAKVLECYGMKPTAAAFQILANQNDMTGEHHIYYGSHVKMEEEYDIVLVKDYATVAEFVAKKLLENADKKSLKAAKKYEKKRKKHEKEFPYTLLHELAHSAYMTGSRENERSAKLETSGSAAGATSKFYQWCLFLEFDLVSELNSRRVGVGLEYKYISKTKTTLKKHYLDRAFLELGKDEDLAKVLEAAAYEPEKCTPMQLETAEMFCRGHDIIKKRMDDAADAISYLMSDEAETLGITRADVTKIMYAAGPTIGEMDDPSFDQAAMYNSTKSKRPLSPLEYVTAAAGLVKKGKLTHDEIGRYTSVESGYCIKRKEKPVPTDIEARFDTLCSAAIQYNPFRGLA